MALIYRTSSAENPPVPSYIKNSSLTYEEGDGNLTYLLTNMSGSTLNLEGDTYITGSVVNIAGDAELQKRLGIWDDYDIEYVRFYAQSSSLNIKKDGAPYLMLQINDGLLGIGQGLTDISGSLTTALLTDNRAYALPNASGTLALSVNGYPADDNGNVTITSFSGDFTGSLFGTASWAISASTAFTASFVTSSNVYGPYGSDSISTASYAASSSYIQSSNVDGPYGGNSVLSSSFAVSASWAPSIATLPGGANTHIQFNSASTFEGDSSFKYNFLSRSLEQGNGVTTVGMYSHAEGGQTKVGTNLAYSASIINGVATLVASYGSVSSSFNVDSYLIVYDVSTQTISPTAYQISQSVFSTPNTIVRLYDNLLNVPNAFVGDVYYYDLSWNGDQQVPADYSHTEGYNTRTLGRGSHAEGNSSIAAADYAHAEGDTTQALGEGSHAEGSGTVAKGAGAHAEGSNTLASGDYSHAEGFNTQAIGLFSHAAGIYTIASGSSQFVVGRYNIPSPVDGAFIIGNGSILTRRNLLFASESQVQISGSLRVTGSARVIGLQNITQANVLTYNISTGEIFYTASNAVGSFPDLSIYTTLATFNNFTASYNTGSFTGSFTGQLIGTASWASNSLTASFVTASNVYGPHGSNSVLSSSFAVTSSWALAAPVPTLQQVTTAGNNTSSSINLTDDSSQTIASLTRQAGGPPGGYTAQLILKSNFATNNDTQELGLNYIKYSNNTGYTSSLNWSGTGTANHLIGIPTATGTLALKVNGVSADASGSITIPTGSFLTTGSLSTTQQLSGSLNITGSLNFFSGSTNAAKIENGWIVLTQVSTSLDFANDAAAAAGGVPLGGLYRNGNAISIRIS